MGLAAGVRRRAVVAAAVVGVAIAAASGAAGAQASSSSHERGPALVGVRPIAGHLVRLSTGRVVSTDPGARSRADEAAFRREITKLAAQGRLGTQAQRRLGLQLLTKPGSAPAEAVTTVAPASRAKGCGVTDAAEQASDISLSTPKIWVSYSSSSYIMYAASTFTWTSPPYAGSTCKTPVGGPDGFALAFNRSVTNLGPTLYSCNSYNKCTYGEGWLETNSGYGAGFGFQDYAGSALVGWSPTYKGTLTYAFRTGGGCTQAFSKYGHSWDSTSLNGFSIGAWSIGVSWSTTTSTWQKSSLAGSYGTC